MRPSKSRSVKARIEGRRALVSELYLKGKTQAEIAEQLGVDQSTISRDLTALQKQWKDSAIRNLDEAKARELAKIDALERTYWDAWERSVGQTQIKTIKAKGDPKGAPGQAEQTIRTEDLNGDPRYLAGVMSCIERRCRLLGIDAPETRRNVDASGNDVPPIVIKVVNEPQKQ